jgi:pyruvate dehydrogenase E1 component alpha subunit
MSREINLKQTTISKEKLLEMLETMLLIRHFEDRIYYLFLQGAMPGTIHLYQGEEGVAVGVCANLCKDDVITSTHRPHGHAIAKGVSVKAVMAELFGKTTGCCRGKGGSMHIGDPEMGALPAIAIVGGNIPIAAGAALAFKFQKRDRVAVSFFGDGASNEGTFHESINMAAIWNLPVIFVCENNLYGASTPVSKVMKTADVAARAVVYGIPGKAVDGNDVIAVYQTAMEAVERARSGGGPTLVECKTYRHGGHSRSDACNYRPKVEKEEWLKKDTILRMKKKLIEMKLLTGEMVKEIEERIEKEIDEAVAFARNSPSPQPEDALTDIWV